GADPTATHGALTRITTYDMGTGLPVAQYAYPLEPLFTAPPDGNVSDTNGVSDLVALDHDHLLVVERASIFKDNNWKIRIFLAERGDATDVLGRDSLAGPPIRTLRKRLLVDLSGVA